MAPDNPPAEQPAGRNAAADETSRTWWHLDDVIPLAVHAASTPSHGLSSAQLLARAPLMPALMWTATRDGDRLTSNGQPGWFDAAGNQHAAHGRTWVDPHHATVATAVDEVGYLPVRGLPGSTFDLVDWLQQAAAGGAHWLSTDITRRRPVIGASQLAVSDQRGDLYPLDATWVEACVACVPATGSGLYPALVAAGYYSNHGGLLARFDRDTAARMVNDLHHARAHRPGFHAVLRWAGERIEVYAENADGFTGLRRYDVVGPDPDGRYPIGAYLWRWLSVDNS